MTTTPPHYAGQCDQSGRTYAEIVADNVEDLEEQYRDDPDDHADFLALDEAGILRYLAGWEEAMRRMGKYDIRRAAVARAMYEWWHNHQAAVP